MAEIVPILGGISAGINILGLFTTTLDGYRRIPHQLLDAKEELELAELLLESWRRKWDVAKRHPNAYYEIFFGGEHKLHEVTKEIINKIKKTDGI